jgi:hypothetical protein
MDDRVHLFGIRHHGPGSAASLVAALDALAPAAVLIEGPSDADALIPYAALPGMRPPLALLAYAADDPASAVFFPFAVFSPEWQAMRWALRHERPVRFIDWPAAMSLASRRVPEEQDAAPEQTIAVAPDGPGEPGSSPPDDLPLDLDPLDRLAEVSGHADGEALWNALVESRGAAREVFAAIAEAMTTLRAETDEAARGPAAALREARREAHMRLGIRQALNDKALKDHDGAIAAVVGAWHVPALRRDMSAADDRATLKGAPRTKTEITWVPWTDTRLATASGYGAGVTSPGWYRHLWSLYEGDATRVAPDMFAATWQAKVARTLRDEGQPAATASAIEAARLAVALAAVRGLATPGLDEMRDATRAALCHGDETPFRLIEGRLVVGHAVGAIDDGVPQMPLAADLARWQRKLRLKPEALEQDISLDLRSETGFAKSTLLHRLDLMGVPWGRLIDAEAGRGTFREVWRLLWEPELSVKLAEALVHGVTIEQAAAGAAVAQAAATAAIQQLAELVRRCLLSDLPAAAQRTIALLQAAAVNAVDMVGLLRAVPSLVSILRYGTARAMPRDALSDLARALANEVIAGIGLACGSLDDAAAERMRQAVVAFDAALVLFGDEHLTEEWSRRLRRLVDDASVTPLVAGAALRLLYDRAALNAESATGAFFRALSPAVGPKAAGQWLEGFLGSTAEVILQDRTLFGLIDAWLGEQKEADFVEVLPMLRRAFGGFSATGRRRLLAEVSKGPIAERTPPAAIAAAGSPGFERALPLLLKILGIERRE